VRDGSWIAGDGRFVEPFVLVVGLVADEQAGGLPPLDGVRVDGEPFGHLGEVEHAGGPEAFRVADRS